MAVCIYTQTDLEPWPWGSVPQPSFTREGPWDSEGGSQGYPPAKGGVKTEAGPRVGVLQLRWALPTFVSMTFLFRTFDACPDHVQKDMVLV